MSLQNNKYNVNISYKNNAEILTKEFPDVKTLEDFI